MALLQFWEELYTFEIPEKQCDIKHKFLTYILCVVTCCSFMETAKSLPYQERSRPR